MREKRVKSEIADETRDERVREVNGTKRVGNRYMRLGKRASKIVLPGPVKCMPET